MGDMYNRYTCPLQGPRGLGCERPYVHVRIFSQYSIFGLVG